MDPLKLDLLDANKYTTQKLIQEVKSTTIKDAITGKFDPEGLFSEEIFGLVGSDDRMIRPGYIELKAKFLHPRIYNNLILMKRHYKGILNGTTNAVFNEKLKDFVVTSADDPKGNTGYSFFIKHFKKIKFKKTNKPGRVDKIKLMDMYPSRDRLLLSRWVLIPAGIREYREADGVEGMEDINNLYMSLIIASRVLPEQGHNDKAFDRAKMTIQLRINAIHAYIFDIILDGKKGYLQGKYAARGLALGTGNVISAPSMATDTPGAINGLSATETKVPLLQSLKAYQPLIIHGLTKLIFNNFIAHPQNAVPLINTKNYQIEYVAISNKVKHKYSSSDGLLKYINTFKDPAVRMQPITIVGENGKSYYSRLIRDTGDTVEYFSDYSDYMSKLGKVTTWETLWEEVEGEPYEGVIEVVFGSGAIKHLGDEVMKFRDKYDLELVYDHLPDKLIIPTIKNWMRLRKTRPQRDADMVNNKSLELYGATNTNRLKHLLAKHNENIKNVESQIRPMTMCEAMYICAYFQVQGKGKSMMITRYPVAGLGGTYPSKAHITTTQISRIVGLVMMNARGNPVLDFLPEYPILTEGTIDSLQLHPSRLSASKGLGGDYDGDTVSGNSVLSTEANEEIDKHLHSPSGLISGDGGLVLVGTDLVNLTLFNMSRDPDRA